MQHRLHAAGCIQGRSTRNSPSQFLDVQVHAPAGALAAGARPQGVPQTHLKVSRGLSLLQPVGRAGAAGPAPAAQLLWRFEPPPPRWLLRLLANAADIAVLLLPLLHLSQCHKGSGELHRVQQQPGALAVQPGPGTGEAPPLATVLCTPCCLGIAARAALCCCMLCCCA